jgi:hypothetical protein
VQTPTATGSPQDWHEIEQLLALFCSAVDRMDFELLKSIFHTDAHTDFGGFVNGPVDEYLAYVASPGGLPSLHRTMHQLSNVNYVLDGDVAHAESYVTAYHEGPADHPWCPGFVVIWARYIDRLEKRDGRWRIAKRTTVVEFGRNVSSGEQLELAHQNLGRRDLSDLRYSQ